MAVVRGAAKLRATMRGAATRVPATCAPPPRAHPCARGGAGGGGIDNWEVNLRSAARCDARGGCHGECVHGSLTPSRPRAGPPRRSDAFPGHGASVPRGLASPWERGTGGDFGDGGAQAAPRGAAPMGWALRGARSLCPPCSSPPGSGETEAQPGTGQPRVPPPSGSAPLPALSPAWGELVKVASVPGANLQC